VRFLDRIDEKLKEQFLTTTLPTNLSSLQEYYPEARRFRTLQQGQLHATDKALLDRAKVRAEEILNRVRRESLDKMRADLSRMRTLIGNVDVQDNTDSDSILILEQHIEDLANAELIALINQKIPHLTPYIAFSKYVFWDEELIRLLFQKILHNVVQRGQLIIPSLVQELRIDWTSEEWESRIDDYLAKLNHILTKHSLDRLWEPTPLKDLLLPVLIKGWPEAAHVEWGNILFHAEPIASKDDFTIALMML
jgi:hypothetical protein